MTRFGFELRALFVVLGLATLVALDAGAASAQGTARPMDAGLQLLGNEPSYLDLAAGAFDIQGHRESPTSGEARVEFRFGQKFLDIGPSAGVLVTTRGGVFGYAGFYGDIVWNRFVLTPLGAVGFYRRGSDEDLGGSFQFRISANLAYELDGGSRLGVQFAHISNAGIHKRNPGDNEMLATYGIPLPF
ncbi:MAG: acyloxyacyl hydrolase [Stellaceae bacterium]